MTGLMLIHLFGYMADRIVGLGGPNGRRSQHCGKGRRSPIDARAPPADSCAAGAYAAAREGQAKLARHRVNLQGHAHQDERRCMSRGGRLGGPSVDETVRETERRLKETRRAVLRRRGGDQPMAMPRSSWGVGRSPGQPSPMAHSCPPVLLRSWASAPVPEGLGFLSCMSLPCPVRPDRLGKSGGG